MKIRNLDLTANPVNEEHQQLGIPPVETVALHPSLAIAVWFTLSVQVALSAYLVGLIFLPDNWSGGLLTIRETLAGKIFWSAAAVGFLAQAVDGALGMAYGITATTFLLSAGASPAVASASVHIAEVFTTGLSGVTHARFGNVNRRLFFNLLAPGILGAVLGAVVVTRIDGAALKPYISAYLLIMGVYILIKAMRHARKRVKETRHVGKLALFGGFIDAAGGGGWGPIVTTTLLSSGNDPRMTIGSVNFVEFFLTLATAASFTLLAAGVTIWPVVAGLVFGGLFAAPCAAYLCKKLHARTLLLLVGTLISTLSIYNLYQALG